MKNEKVAQLSEGSELLQREPEVTSVNLGNSDLAIQRSQTGHNIITP